MEKGRYPLRGYILLNSKGEVKKVVRSFEGPLDSFGAPTTSIKIPGLMHYVAEDPNFYIALTRIVDFMGNKSYLQPKFRLKALVNLNKKAEEIARALGKKKIFRRTWMFGAHPKLLENKRSPFYGYKPAKEAEHKKAVKFFKEHPEFKRSSGLTLETMLHSGPNLHLPSVRYYKELK